MYQGHSKPIKRDLPPHNPVVFRHTTGLEHLTGGMMTYGMHLVQSKFLFETNCSIKWLNLKSEKNWDRYNGENTGYPPQKRVVEPS